MATIPIRMQDAQAGDRITVQNQRNEKLVAIIDRGAPDIRVRLFDRTWLLDDLVQRGVITVERDVPDLPTIPGVVFRATVHGVEGVQLMFAPGGDNDSTPYAGYPEVAGMQWHSAKAIDPATVELATITWPDAP